MLVMDDLFAHINRGAVSFERALDRLDSAIDTGAITARSCEQNFCWSIHCASVYEELAATQLIDQLVDAFAGHVERPRAHLVDAIGERVAP